MSKIMYKGRSYANAGVSSDATSIPTADMAAAFDSNAHMNSTDMTSQEVEDFLADINAQGTPSEYKKLLWTNPSPSSTFDAQTILSSVDLSEYDEFEIVVRNYISGDIYNICRLENASPRQIWVFDTSNFTGNAIPMQLSRIINISSSGMAISEGYSKAYNSTATPSNSVSVCLPIKIYGIKYERVAPPQLDASDYVVEQGISGIWTYRKWNSGIAECWGRYSASTAISTAWGSIYYGGVSLPNYPFSFTALPSRHATLDTPGGLAWIVPNSTNTTVSNPGGMFVFSAGSNASVGCNISVYAIGRWK